VAEKILVVDDSTFIVDGLVAILKKKGYATIASYGGDE
jgi:CheY-like chemotaxis protein